MRKTKMYINTKLLRRISAKSASLCERYTNFPMDKVSLFTIQMWRFLVVFRLVASLSSIQLERACEMKRFGNCDAGAKIKGLRHLCLLRLSTSFSSQTFVISSCTHVVHASLCRLVGGNMCNSNRGKKNNDVDLSLGATSLIQDR